MIAPSQASVLADDGLRVPERTPSHVRSGQTKDGVVWVASFVGARASFRAEGCLSRELLTRDQANSLIAVAPMMTIWELRIYAGGIQ
jgi:hypothetical protein